MTEDVDEWIIMQKEAVVHGHAQGVAFTKELQQESVARPF